MLSASTDQLPVLGFPRILSLIPVGDGDGEGLGEAIGVAVGDGVGVGAGIAVGDGVGVGFTAAKKPATV